MRKCNALILTGFIVLSLAGCGSVSGINETRNFAESNSLSFGAEKSAMATDGVYEDYDGSYDDYSESEADIVKNTMMIVRNANISVDVENVDSFTESITQTVLDMGGYFEESNINDYSSDYATSRYAYYTIRIPSEKLDDFLSIVDGESNITSNSVTSEDVSLEYVDVEAHISALESERENLERLLEQTTEVSDLIQIEDRLSAVQASLDSYNGQKRILEGRVSYSTVWLNAREERFVDHPVREAFAINLKEKMLDGMETAVEVFVNILTAIPVIIIVTAFVIFFLWVLKKVFKKVFKSHSSVKYMWMPVMMEDEPEPVRPSRKDKKIAKDIDKIKVEN